MTRRNLPIELQELLADRATQGLDGAERARAEALLDAEGLQDDLSLDLAAAELDLALAGVTHGAPATSVERLMGVARDWQSGVARVGTAQRNAAISGADDVLARIGEAPRRRMGAAGAFGWLAAAACLTLALLGWFNRGAGLSNPARQEQRLLARQDTIQWRWQPTENSRLAGLEGRVAFNLADQQGVLRVRNLPALGPDQQYQLWIVDPGRKQPVDGGVFDAPAVTADGEALIPVSARLRVDKPAAFAITIERRGGVVVSDGPLQAVAAPPAG